MRGYLFVIVFICKSIACNCQKVETIQISIKTQINKVGLITQRNMFSQ